MYLGSRFQGVSFFSSSKSFVLIVGGPGGTVSVEAGASLWLASRFFLSAALSLSVFCASAGYTAATESKVSTIGLGKVIQITSYRIAIFGPLAARQAQITVRQRVPRLKSIGRMLHTRRAVYRDYTPAD